MEDDLPEGAVYAGRSNGVHTWKAEPPEVDAEGKTASFVLYSGAEVRFNPAWQTGGDIIRTKEFRLGNFKTNPVVLADHDPTKVIGRGTAKIVDQGQDSPAQLHGTATWDIHENNPLAVLIAGQHARGMRQAVSIGFIPGKGSGPRTRLAAEDPAWLDPEKVSSWAAGWLMRYPDLLEWSSVSTPKDPGALQLQQWAAEAETLEQRIERVVREIVSREHATWVLQAVRSDTQVRASIAAVALEQVPHNPTPAPANPGDWFDEDWQ